MVGVVLTVLVLCASTMAAPRDQGRVKRYHVAALEGGIIVHEDITVAGNVETINMPAHNGLDAVLTINDFNKQWTVRAMLDKETCYIMPLEDIFQEPSILEKAMESGQEGVWKDTKNISYTYSVVGKVITEKLDFLPEAAQEVCQDWPVFYVVPTEEQEYTQTQHGLHVKKSKLIGQEKRQKRQIDSCPSDFVMSACKFVNRFCHYIKTCTIRYDPAVQQDVTQCGDTVHRFGKNECCRRCCTEQEFSSQFTPFCADMTERDIDCANPVVQKTVRAP